jgi:hypothetical protein
MRFKLPDKTKTEEGKQRHVGFELEFSGLNLKDSACILNKVISGNIESENSFSLYIKNDKWGTFGLEVDAAVLKDEKYKKILSEHGFNLDELDVNQKLDGVLESIATTLVPCEIVTPPLPMSDLNIMNEITDALKEAKAEGTKASILYAFGLHINTELVSFKSSYLLNHMRAFTLLYDWICKESRVDLARRLMPYIKPYPDEYILLITAPDYEPGERALIEDYMEYVGSRNYALDMLPAFAEIERNVVMDKAEEPELIKARPAFHYRLANCLIDEVKWTIADEWQYWLAIEKLAADEELLKKTSLDYREHFNESFFSYRDDWVAHIDEIIK